MSTMLKSAGCESTLETSMGKWPLSKITIKYIPLGQRAEVGVGTATSPTRMESIMEKSIMEKIMEPGHLKMVENHTGI